MAVIAGGRREEKLQIKTLVLGLDLISKKELEIQSVLASIPLF